MTLQFGYLDPQWSRALGAVTVALIVLFGVARAGGPVALARETSPVARVVAEVYCAAVTALHQDGIGLARDLRPSG